MLRIPIPARATVVDSQQLIARCGEAEREPGPVELDCRATTNFGPFGIALIAATIALRRSEGRTTTIVPPTNAGAADFLTEVGLDAFARGTRTGEGTLEVRQLTALDALYTDLVTRILVRGVPGIAEADAYPIQLCLNELLQNVFEWSESPIGCTVLARWYRKTRSVRLAVIDRGIGIPAALRRKRTHGLHRSSDADVIEAAVTTPRLTSRDNQVGGLGLKTIREVVCGRSGRLCIVSLGAKLTWTPAKLMKARSTPLRGTAIELDFRPAEPFVDPGGHIPVF